MNSCRIKLKKNLHDKISQMSNVGYSKNLKDAKIIAENVNNAFGFKVVDFYLNNDILERDIVIPEKLIDKYYQALDDNTVQKELDSFNRSYFGDSFSSEYDYAATVVDNIYNFAKMVATKKVQITLVQNKIKTIKEKLKLDKNDKALLKELQKLTALLENESTGLKAEIKEIEKSEDVASLDHMFQKDMDYINKLITNGNIKDIEEAKLLLSFYLTFNPKVTKKNHAFQTEKSLYDEATGAFFNTIPPSVEAIYQKYYNKASELSNQLSIIEDNLIAVAANEMPNMVDMLGRAVTKNDLFHTKEGMADINWFTQMIQDPQFQFGYTSKNPVITQVALKLLQDAVFKHEITASSFEIRLAQIETDLYKKLPKNKWLFGTSAPDFSMFFAKNTEGGLKSNIINRFSTSYYEAMRRQNRKFEKAIQKVFLDNKSLSISPTTFQTLLNNIKKEMLEHEISNHIFLDINLLSEFTGTENEASTKLRESIIGEVGEKAYNEAVEHQKELIADFNRNLEVYIENLLHELDEGYITNEEYEKSVADYHSKNNPNLLAKNIADYEVKGTVPNVLSYKNLFLAKIPRKNVVVIDKRKIVTSISATTGGTVNTKYYDEAFQEIESDETLLSFYHILKDFMFDIENNLTPDDKAGYDIFSIPFLEKTLKQILLDPTLDNMAKVSQIIAAIIAKIKNLFLQPIQSTLSRARKNPNTGDINYVVNSDFLKSNKTIIDKNFRLAILELISKEVDVDSLLFEPFEHLTALLPYTHFKTEADLRKALHTKDIKKIIKEKVVHDVMANQSLDLPLIIRNFSTAMAAYKARNEVLPLMTILKDRYNKIKAPKLTNTGRSVYSEDDETILSEERVRANTQFNSWFNRAVLGNFENSKVDGIYNKSNIKLTGNDAIDSKLTELNAKLSDKLQSKTSRERQDLMDALVKSKTANEQNISDLNTIINNEQTYFSFSRFFDKGVLSAIRFLGLGYNISSSMTNLFEGQISNLIAASSGKYYSEKSYWEALAISKYSMLRTFQIKNPDLVKDKVPNSVHKKFMEADLARHLMDNLNLLQDTYNELQKASVKSKIDLLSKVNAKSLSNKTEYVNQVIVMIAVLKDTKIEDSNLWDAYMEGYQEGNIGKLGSRFTDENDISNYNNVPGDNQSKLKITNLKGKIIDITVKLHGDYNDLRGNLASESIPGKSLMMFKRWFGSYLYNRFGDYQYNLHTGTFDKGRFRSFSTGSAAVYGTVASSLFLGPLGGVLTGAAFGMINHFSPKTLKAETKNLTVLGDMAQIAISTLKKMAQIPFNFAGGTWVIDNSKIDNSYNKEDAQNIKANITEMAILMWITALVMIVKAAAWDDDDDETDKRRIAHNIIVNKLVQLSEQSVNFLTVGLYDSYFGEGAIAPLRYVIEIEKTAKAGIKFLEGDDTILAGPNATESRFYNQIKKVAYPSVMKGLFGFENISKKQFTSLPLDKYYFNESTTASNEINRLKNEYKGSLSDLSKEEIAEAVKKKFRRRKKGESPEQYLQNYLNSIEEID